MESLFNKISFHQIKSLLSAISIAKDNDYDFIKIKYKSSATDFDFTLDFLEGLRISKKKDGKIEVNNEIGKFIKNGLIDERLLKRYLLDKVLTVNIPFSKEISKYLKNFKLLRNSFIYKPTNKEKIEESGIRNFFVELDLIQYDGKSRVYRITDRFFLIFAKYIENNKITSKELSYIIRKQIEIGESAEMVILDYERKRLADYPHLIIQLEHVSKSDVTAGCSGPDLTSIF